MVSDNGKKVTEIAETVLILVVMEYGLRQTVGISGDKQSLNPCCNGIWSQTSPMNHWKANLGLNPCCNGIWSQTQRSFHIVLIILCLNPCCNGIWSQTWGVEPWRVKSIVLILVVMEYGLRHVQNTLIQNNKS